MATKQDCIRALQIAAERIGESPTKAQYEALDLTPASGTIMRVMGSWNAAKQVAGLETYEQGERGGPSIAQKPDGIELPGGTDWEQLSGNQRWYYKNRKQEIAKKDERRAMLRQWLYEYKRKECQCEQCNEGHPACLDFHHVGEKELGIAEMVARGYSPENILEEISQCMVLCANCHRKEHYEYPDGTEGTSQHS